MITALDSSVLWALIKNEPGAELWASTLQTAASEGPLVLCPVAYAEIAPSVGDARTLDAFLGQLQIAYDPIRPEAAFLAGQIFRSYRHQGGPREHLVPDFLIAAHAQVQAQRLAAIDRGYLRRWFPRLTLLVPKAA